jgi:transcription elongation factor GreA
MSSDTIPITPAGLAKLKADLRRIKEVERLENVREIEAALEHGDLRENAEYHAAKERQAQIDGQMRLLEYQIGRAEIIDPAMVKSNRVGFGATVTLLDLDSDEEVVYAVVGESEADIDRGRVSIMSPIARAMLGKQEGDSFVLKLPKGDREFEVVKLAYKALD